MVPIWNNETCLQCGKCALICPHGAIRTKVLTEEQLKNAPSTFKVAKYKTKELGEDLYYCVQVSTKDCTGCGLCVNACPVKTPVGDDKFDKALSMESIQNVGKVEEENFAFFETIPYIDRAKLNPQLPKHTQLMQPLFEFSGACAGCGEAGYIKLITQLFGDRMMVANATGCSSIYGGNLPTTPYAKNSAGEGPAWSNSLFEDNAEYGYGQALAVEKLQNSAIELLKSLASVVGDDFVVSNNFVYLTHRKVINLLLDLHAEWNSQHMGSQNGVLKALKKMKYVNSSNILKGIYYPFLSSTKFAAKLQNQR